MTYTEEAEGMLMGQEEEEAPAHEGEAQVLVEADKDATAEELAKKQGTRKRLFKPKVVTAGSTKMRIASALVSPRKRAAAKPGIRHGENSKQLESKGPSNLKSGHQKVNLWIKSILYQEIRVWSLGLGF